jgi:hypothetical protein
MQGSQNSGMTTVVKKSHSNLRFSSAYAGNVAHIDTMILQQGIHA